jgi:hypothetical protein
MISLLVTKIVIYSVREEIDFLVGFGTDASFYFCGFAVQKRVSSEGIQNLSM